MSDLCAEYGGDDHVGSSRSCIFSAAHRLHVLPISDAENRMIYGKCNNLTYTGTVKRTIGATTSRVIDLMVIDRISFMVTPHLIGWLAEFLLLHATLVMLTLSGLGML
jgi:hypothetical protein